MSVTITEGSFDSAPSPLLLALLVRKSQSAMAQFLQDEHSTVASELHKSVTREYITNYIAIVYRAIFSLAHRSQLSTHPAATRLTIPCTPELATTSVVTAYSNYLFTAIRAVRESFVHPAWSGGVVFGHHDGDGTGNGNDITGPEPSRWWCRGDSITLGHTIEIAEPSVKSLRQYVSVPIDVVGSVVGRAAVTAGQSAQLSAVALADLERRDMGLAMWFLLGELVKLKPGVVITPTVLPPSSFGPQRPTTPTALPPAEVRVKKSGTTVKPPRRKLRRFLSSKL